MTAQFLFYLLIGLLILEFIWDNILDYLNARHFNDPIPAELDGIFDQDEYKKSQLYKAANHRFSQWHDGFNFVLMLTFFIVGGFAYLDSFVKQFSENQIVISLAFIGILAFVGSLISLPFAYYDTFVIEEKFGFNKTTRTTFWLDQIKGAFMSVIIGGLLLWAILWFYHRVGSDFWWYAWILFTVFTILMTLFYSNLIVPLFNKQKPLDEGELKDAINQFAQKTGFKLDNIYVIDGSKRSTKANAYFTGFGPKKRVVLYDTLIHDLNINEIVAVLAHEIGHYQKKHVFYNLIMSILLTGLTLYILGYFVSNPILSQALGVSQSEFHIGIIAFGILYSPISEITGLGMNILSRKFEYQADAYAKTHYHVSDLISGLKKLSKKSLSNLTPHPWYVFWHYSHPTLLQRIKKLSGF